MGRDLYHSKEDEISFSNICSVFAAASANSRNLGQKFSVDFALKCIRERFHVLISFIRFEEPLKTAVGWFSGKAAGWGNGTLWFDSFIVEALFLFFVGFLYDLIAHCSAN